MYSQFPHPRQQLRVASDVGGGAPLQAVKFMVHQRMLITLLPVGVPMDGEQADQLLRAVHCVLRTTAK